MMADGSRPSTRKARFGALPQTRSSVLSSIRQPRSSSLASSFHLHAAVATDSPWGSGRLGPIGQGPV